jgi:hypothetical protein
MQDDFNSSAAYQKQVIRLLTNIQQALWLIIGAALGALIYWRWF